MRVSVISPHTRKNGNTTLAMLIALEVSKQGKNSCITHINPLSNSFFKYLNFMGYQDKTSTPSQIVKIIKEVDIADDDITDYCKRVSGSLEAFTNNTTNFSQEDMNFMIDYIAKSFPHEYVIFDVDNNDLEQSQKVVELSDIVVLNITQSVIELEKFRDNKERYIELLGDKPVAVVVNKYNSIKGTLKEAANWMGAKRFNNVAVLHENPWITWATNHGRLNQLYKRIGEKDSRVIELNADLIKIVNTIIKVKITLDKKQGRKRR